MKRLRSVLGLALGAHAWYCGSPDARAEVRAPEASPSDVALAEKYAAEAFDAYGRKAYAEAVALYQQAMAAAPSADISYNIARVYDLGSSQRGLAIEYYERYVADPGAVPDRVRVANQRLTELRAAEQAAAEALDAIASEFPQEMPEDEAPPALSATDHSSLGALGVTALVVGGVGLASVGLGVGFGLSARAESDVWRRYCDGNECSSQRGVDAAESAADDARLATIGFAAGGGLLALATVLWLVDSPGEVPTAAAQVRLVPVASDAEFGWSVSASF